LSTHSQRKLFCSAQQDRKRPKWSRKREANQEGAKSEDTHCRILAVVGTGTPTQGRQLMSSNPTEKTSGFGRCHTEKRKTEQATTNQSPESSTSVTRSRKYDKEEKRQPIQVLTKIQTKEASSKHGR